jgi:hypothetical protein
METGGYDPRDHAAELRASDAQREVVAAVVRGALDDGRLQLDELDDRLGAVYQAKTHGELAAVIGDIVPPPVRYRPPVRGAPPPAVRYQAAPPAGVSDRKILPAFLLCFLLGPFGAHRFYAGKTGSGVAMLVLTLSIIGVVVTGIWALVDLIVLIVGAFRDGGGRRMRDWT